MKRDDLAASEHQVKVWLLVVSLTTIGFLAAAALRETLLADWYRYRSGYSALLEAKADDARGKAAAEQFELRIVQNYVPELGVADRCTTCHAGVQDPRMAGQAQPFSTHPGKYLENHDPDKFGCTVCHQGQGRATETADAHGRVDFWDYPLLGAGYVRATCSKCHAEEQLYGDGGLIAKADGPDSAPSGASEVERGRRMFGRLGCLGCHAKDGKGGSLGPDLSRVGDKTAHNFVFSHLGKDVERSVTVWHTAHFMNPQEVSPGSLMPAVARDAEDAKALTAYMLSLRAKQSSYDYSVPGSESGPTGRDLYAGYCSACHGPDGRADGIAGINTPALNNPDTLAAADDDYYRFIIEKGRSGSRMPAWGEGHGNLSREEIDAVVAYMREWEAQPAKVVDISSRRGAVGRGRAYYNGLCAGCHGLEGEGGIGTALASPTFQSVADDSFLARTIVSGRPGTAMPSWKQLEGGEISDILAYIRSWRPQPASFEDVTAALSSTSNRDEQSENRRVGSLLYGRYCSACHGRKLEGKIGPSLSSPEFLAAVDDIYLFRAITEGRPSTAMPAWRGLSAPDVASLIAYLRSFQSRPRFDLAAVEVAAGDYEVGEVRYRVSCQRCHGIDGVGGVGPQLANRVFLSSASNQALYTWIAHGRTGTAMKGFLASEQGPTQLEPGHIADIIAYLRYLGTRDLTEIARTGAGNTRVGEDLFAGTCASCHGPRGEGASAPQLNNPALLASASDGFLAATIVLGRSGTPMRPMVHGVEGGLGQVAPENVADLVAYIRQWEGPRAWRGERRIAELSAAAISDGRDLFSHYCAGCHGTNGRGGLDGEGYHAPALNNQEFLEAASDGFLLATIARGRSGTPMRPFGRGGGGIASLGGDEIDNIVAYIRSWQK